MRRALAGAVLVLGGVGLAGCQAVPAAVMTAAAGAGLGYAASVNDLATEIIKVRSADLRNAQQGDR